MNPEENRTPAPDSLPEPADKPDRPMTVDELTALIIDALEDVKGQDIRVFDTTRRTSAFERAIIASGTSNRQTRALAASVAHAVKKARIKVRGLEGTETGEWVLVDCGSVIVHCMQPSVRRYYNLEELWDPKTDPEGPASLSLEKAPGA